jgi:prepilin-type N-terminal cleavage/methylation domain-containing protein
MELISSNRPAARAAFTLPEMLVGTVIGALLLVFASSFYVFSMRSFVCLANYSDLNLKSRYASDLISRDLRSAKSVASLSANQLVLNQVNGVNNVNYTFDPAHGTLTRADGKRTQVLLTQIVSNSFTFAFYARPTNNLYESFPSNAPNGAKLVGCRWSCTRPVMAGSPTNSESIQMALVNLRNQ